MILSIIKCHLVKLMYMYSYNVISFPLQRTFNAGFLKSCFTVCIPGLHIRYTLWHLPSQTDGSYRHSGTGYLSPVVSPSKF